MSEIPEIPEDAFKAMTDGLYINPENEEAALEMMKLVRAVFTASMLVGFTTQQSMNFAWALYSKLIGAK